MDSQHWQQLPQQQVQAPPRPAPAVVASALAMGGVPMKGVILANRKTIFHKTRVCPRLGLGACHLGSKCNFAHSLEELRPAPNLDKTKLCPSVLHPGIVCPAKARGEVCRFAHNNSEIRHTSNMFKTNMCLKWIRGKCKKDAQCSHAHGHQELKYYRSLAMASGSRDFARESEATFSRRRKQNGSVGPSAAPPLAGLTDILYSPQQQQKQLTDSYRQADSSSSSIRHETLYSLLTRNASTSEQLSKSSCPSVDVALAALYEELLRCKAKGEGFGGSRGGMGASLNDDSTTAADECSDFSSFSSRCLTDALRSTSSTVGTCGGRMNSPEVEAVLASPASAPTCPGASVNNSNDLSLGMDQLVLLKALAERGALVRGAAERQAETQQGPDMSRAAVSMRMGNSSGVAQSKSSGLEEALGSSLARLCLGDLDVRQHCYADPPPGFERELRQQQQQAVVDLDRLASASGFD
ncbi:uncharacterized protein LOC34622502 [Cyclospora cayetanensis]|nr:uncharacterized protein LOC34622502 [Cyclospora cayetanensis]